MTFSELKGAFYVWKRLSGVRESWNCSGCILLSWHWLACGGVRGNKALRDALLQEYNWKLFKHTIKAWWSNSEAHDGRYLKDMCEDGRIKTWETDVLIYTVFMEEDSDVFNTQQVLRRINGRYFAIITLMYVCVYLFFAFRWALSLLLFFRFSLLDSVYTQNPQSYTIGSFSFHSTEKLITAVKPC